MDGYNWGNVGAWHTWESFSALFQQTYNDLLTMTAKPMMIGEMASTEQAGNKASWISDAYTTQIPHYFPRIKAVIWFNIDKETDWRIESSPAAQNAFAAAIQTGIYASNNYAYLNVSPIPVPLSALLSPIQALLFRLPLSLTTSHLLPLYHTR